MFGLGGNCRCHQGGGEQHRHGIAWTQHEGSSWGGQVRGARCRTPGSNISVVMRSGTRPGRFSPVRHLGSPVLSAVGRTGSSGATTPNERRHHRDRVLAPTAHADPLRRPTANAEPLPTPTHCQHRPTANTDLTPRNAKRQLRRLVRPSTLGPRRFCRVRRLRRLRSRADGCARRTECVDRGGHVLSAP